jgi:exopolysaccharide biosynthesis protein
MRKILVTAVIVCIFALFGGGLFFYGTERGHNIRRMLAGSILSTQHPQFARFLLSASEIEELNWSIFNPPNERSDVPKSAPVDPQYPALSVEVETVNNPNFTAKVMKVTDPTKIHVVSTKHKNRGQPLSELIAQNGAIAGINAGAFYDPSGVGTGGQIVGIVISDGKVSSEQNASYDTPSLVCGFTNTGQFITGTYTINELLKMGVTQAVTFGPQLLVNSQDMVTDTVNNAFGWAPRTAIGQQKDGTVVMIVTDGRFYWDKRHRGASMKDLVKLFQTYEAVNAFALDGGGSTTMIYNGQLQLKPATNTAVGMRYLPNAFVVIPD